MAEQMQVSLIQGLVNAMEESADAKRRGVEILDQLKSWLDNSLMRDTAFKDRLVRAITDNSPHIDLLESGMAQIAGKFGAGNGGDNAQSDNTQ